MNAREAALLSAARDVVEYKRGLTGTAIMDAMLADAVWDLTDAVDEYRDEE